MLRTSAMLLGGDGSFAVFRQPGDANTWIHWALLSAGFAALTAIFAKLGVQGVDSDVATFIRTVIIIMVLGVFLVATRKWQDQRPRPRPPSR